MSSSVLGLGAAALGAASLGARSLGNKPGKMVKVPQPSAKDYQLGQMGLIWGDTNKFYSSDKDRIKAAFGSGPVIGGSGKFFYGGSPTRVPEGYTVLRGPDISVQGRNVNSGSYNTNVETYRLVRLQQPQPQGEPRSDVEAREMPKPLPQLDLSQGGAKNLLNLADVKHAKQQGATRQEIRKAAEAQDIRMSKAVAANLYHGLDLSRGGKNNTLNLADIKHAKQQGASRSEIRQAVEAQDIRMSAKAKARLYKENKNKDK